MPTSAKRRYILIGAAIGLCVPVVVSLVFALQIPVLADMLVTVMFVIWILPVTPFMAAGKTSPVLDLFSSPIFPLVLWTAIGALCGWWRYEVTSRREQSAERVPRQRIRSRGLIAASIVTAVIVLVPFLLILHAYRANRPFTVIAMKAVLPDGDLLEYGWERHYRFEGFRAGYLDNLTFLRWTHRGRTKRFRVHQSDRPAGPTGSDVFEIRATPDLSGIWVVSRNRERIIATLDRRTGAFSIANSVSDSAPTWAKLTGGRVLVSVTGIDALRIDMRAHSLQEQSEK